MENFNFNYDSESDDLFVYLKGKKSSGAIELGNFILDFDDNNNLVAMQILNASEVFSKILSNLQNPSVLVEVKVEIVDFRNMDAIKFTVSDGKVEEKANIFLPHIKEKSPVLKY